MKRSEQDIRFQWDLTKIYPDTAAWEAAMQEAEAVLAPLAAIPGTLGTSKEAFKKGLDTVYASMFKVEMPYVYAFLKKTEDGSVAENQEMAARSEGLLVKFSAATAFLNPEILAIPAEKLDEWMQDEALATYRQFGDAIATLYGGSVKFDTYFSNQRGYASACEAALDGGNVPVSVYDSLIEAVHESLPSMRKYLELRRRALKLDKIDVFDLYVPIVEDVDYPIAFEDAKELVKKATLPLGEEYQKLLDRAFAERWVDVYENDGKQSGAFSCGVFGVHPYVLMNYAGTLNDAFTLAHELGHSMHSWFSDTTQDYVNHDYRIMVAEVASTVNEVLLTKYLLKTETDEKRRAYILNHFLESFRTTLYRQTLFAEFERKAHDLYAAGQPLTATSLNKVYHDLEATYYDGIGIDADIDPEWSYVPHFYRAFYVYQYATGFSSAVAIAEHILTTGDASGYLKFLTTGGSDYPLEELKIAGVDLTKPDTVRSALRVFDETIDELAKILL